MNNIFFSIYYLAIRKSSNYFFRRKIAAFVAWIAKRRAKVYGTLVPYGDICETVNTSADQLERSGLLVLEDAAPQDVIDELSQIARNNMCIDQYRPSLGGFSWNEPHPSAAFGSIDRKVLISNPRIMSYVTSSSLMSIAERYLGAPPTISSVDLWWTFPSEFREATDSQFFHRDCTDWRFLKFFVYLSDVSQEDGAHIFVTESHSSSRLSRIRRYSDHEVREHYPEEQWSTITGKRGTCFFEDTYGLHKGSVPLHQPRLLFQVLYSLGRVGGYSYSDWKVNSEYLGFETRLFRSD